MDTFTGSSGGRPQGEHRKGLNRPQKRGKHQLVGTLSPKQMKSCERCIIDEVRINWRSTFYKVTSCQQAAAWERQEGF